MDGYWRATRQEAPMLTLYRRHAPHLMTQPLENPDGPLEDDPAEPEPEPGADNPFMPEQPPGPNPDPAPQRT